MNKFKIGDKVIAKKNAPYFITTNGWTGEVVKVQNNEFINVTDYKEINSLGTSVESKYFELVPQPKIIITTDGNITTAKLYEGKQVTKIAKAICSPEDKFDFNYGASLALERLTGFVRGSIESTLDTKMDWDKFGHRKLQVKVNKEKFNDFMKQCEERHFNWENDMFATKFNPWEVFELFPEVVKLIICAVNDDPKEFIWLSINENASLVWSSYKEEDLEEYEFI